VSRFLAAPAVFLAIAGLAIGGCGSEDPPKGPDLPTQLAALEGAPPKLAALHAQANTLLGGGPRAFKRRLAELKGRPVVVNKWASWCGPCREEFPVFQRLGAKLGKRIAFVGVDGNDNDDDAREFLESYPVSYPSYKDPTLEIERIFNATIGFPSTAFYDSKGGLAYVKHGPYRDDADLLSDIRRYAR
jgi:thiol-disulfide isomerase/thioredoxin